MWRRIRHSLALSALSAPLAACSPTLQQPRVLHPGPAPVQRYNAAQFDPYPQTDMGPKIVGGRPIDYMTPVPEVERANQFRNGERPINVAATGPIPGAPVLAPVVVPTTPVFGPTLPAYPAYPPTPVYTPAPGLTSTPSPVRY